MRLFERLDKMIRYYAQRILQTLFPPKSGGVFVFHEVVDNIDDAVLKEFAITTEDFISFIDALLNRGMEFGRFDNGVIDPYKAYFSFDDGFGSLMDTAIPELERRGIQYIIFMPVDYVGKTHYLSKTELCRISTYANAIIGSHSKSHCKFLDLSMENACYEAKSSKSELEDMIDKSIDYFAFPYGSFNAVGKVGVASVKNAGYKYAFSTVDVNHRLLHWKYFYPRITVTSTNYRRIIERF